MRPRFEKDIRGFAEVAEEELELEKDSPDSADRLAIVLDWHLEKAAERQHTDIETQKEIYNLQKKKQEIMHQLKARLACFDNSECQSEKGGSERSAKFDESSHGFKYSDDNGAEQIASFGDIVTDIDWGIYYDIDKTTPHLMAKKYFVERAKAELRELLDSQIIKSEVGGDISHDFKRQTYKIIEEERASGVAEKRLGFISESIVKNFLKKISLNNKDLPFEIHEADVFQDVEQKIDFIIHIKERSRGVGVEASEKAKDVGIQFTIAPDLEKKKREQVDRSRQQLRRDHEHIQDIALVVFPLAIADVFKGRWIRRGRPAGGPDKFLYRDIANNLFTKLLKDMFSPEEIESAWQTVKSNFEERN